MKRFKFGRNWENFISSLNEDQIEFAKKDLLNMLHVNSLSQKSFLDAGSGSGLSSLAAVKLDAKVCSFDFDPITSTTDGNEPPFLSLVMIIKVQ